MPASRGCLAAVVVAAWSCRQTTSEAGRASEDADVSPIATILRDQASSFVAVTPVFRGDAFCRRTYARGSNRVEITIARMPNAVMSYASWLGGAREYPPVPLPIGPDLASGFFTCADPANEAACDAHIQFRSGFHVEAMGNGRVPKSDLVELLSKLDLAILADWSGPPK